VYSGKATGKDRIAVIRIDGVLMEGLTTYTQKQIEKAARDPLVKGVVLRINSPGGTMTASDDLFKRIRDLRDGLAVNQKGGKKPVVVSMGAISASGGYYIAMAGGKPKEDSESAAPPAPGKYLFAERTTWTVSIGVYVSLPNISKLADKYGITMNTIKAGDVKDSGSMFHVLKPEERELWQLLVDRAYLQFLHVVEEGRPQLKGKLQQDIVIDETLPVRSAQQMDKHFKYTRYRADGGIYTAEEAKKYGLIDAIGYLDDAIMEARTFAGLPEDAPVVMYDKPGSLFSALAGNEAKQAAPALDAGRLAQGAVPRLWYLAPQSELAGFLAAIGRD
jgi:protease-4